MRLEGGLIDRADRRAFTFDGRSYEGFGGDTIASALLANGVRLMGRSFKYHRPRGPMTAGSEEPNALLEVGEGARRTPNTRATVTELVDGMTTRSQNRWPSLRFDAMAVNDALSPFFAAGFYYKTFMWPRAFWEKLYEPMIRRAAGLGSLSGEPDPDEYDHGYLHCDLLVAGAGPAGLAAALTAGRAGARVIVADEDFRAGGRLLAERHELGDWLDATLAELAALPNVRVMTRTSIIGAFDHGVFGAVEDVGGAVRQVLWRIYAKRAVLAAGATERVIAFANNDRPGVMQAGALRAYANRWAASPGKRVALFVNNDDALRTAADLRSKGVEVAAVIDVREDGGTVEAEHFRNAVIADTSGRLGLTGITVRLASGEERRIACDALGVSGGWNPNVHMTSHHRERPVWNETIAAFVPGPNLPDRVSVAGAMNGDLSTAGALRSGAEAARTALADLDIEAPAIDLPDAGDEAVAVTPFWHVEGAKRAWLDPQNDVTVKDVRLAHQEGFRAVEHLKRYTTLGMATDQGKTANMGGLAVMAQLSGQPIQSVGTTMYRPPYSPVAIGALAGRSVAEDFKPTRLTPSHLWAEEQGAVFVEVGQWLRAQWFPLPGETHWRESVDREALAVRERVGVCDVTTLGKIDVQGTDAAEFLNRVYANGFAKLAPNRVRYGVMLREDGIAMDDGTCARLAPDHFVVTTTTANAVPVYRHMEFVRQCLYPDLDVQLISTTEAWAQYAVAGPRARDLLAKIVDRPFDISNEAFPFMACDELTVCGGPSSPGVRARLFRISFSGELAYEIAVPTRYGDALVRALMEAGEEFGVVPYGTEALGVLRIEKGHAAGNELNGTTTAAHLGLGRMVSKAKDSIGAVLAEREGLVEKELRLVGLRPADGATPFKAGSHLVANGHEALAAHDEGYVTSACHSPNLGHPIALAFLERGAERMGERVRAVNPLEGEAVEVEVVSPHFVDPEGTRLKL